MYREMLHKRIELYCHIWPCDRECGKFHKRFINTTKLRRMKTTSESIDQQPSTLAKSKEKGVFEEIMEMAARKDSQNFIQTPLPPLPEAFQSMTLGRTKHMKRQSTKDADTTMILFDNPVWDDAKFRQELLDSDEERYSIGDAPYIVADDDTLEDILRDTQHESASNPIEHYEADETILSSDDENDYSTLNLRNTTNKSLYQARSIRRSPDAKYEGSIMDL